MRYIVLTLRGPTQCAGPTRIMYSTTGRISSGRTMGRIVIFFITLYELGLARPDENCSLIIYVLLYIPSY
jgi:hypothetical protein